MEQEMPKDYFLIVTAILSVVAVIASTVKLYLIYAEEKRMLQVVDQAKLRLSKTSTSSNNSKELAIQLDLLEQELTCAGMEVAIEDLERAVKALKEKDKYPQAEE
jgi:hypothetical protein